MRPVRVCIECGCSFEPAQSYYRYCSYYWSMRRFGPEDHPDPEEGDDFGYD